jgi:hypothetical protein
MKYAKTVIQRIQLKEWGISKGAIWNLHNKKAQFGKDSIDSFVCFLASQPQWQIDYRLFPSIALISFSKGWPPSFLLTFGLLCSSSAHHQHQNHR